MKLHFFMLLVAGSAWANATDPFIATAEKTHGTAGKTAAEFLVDHMPENDRQQLEASFLTENLDLAFKARTTFVWAKAVPDSIFLNDVLPYAVLDETREMWRPEYFEQASEIVKEATSATEAAQRLNRSFFDAVNVHYNTGRKKPNQSPSESADQGRATCTGLSIILVDACRSVGIPARIAGTPSWTARSGNHTWVEIWDGEWHFLGADEYDQKGVDRGWFVKNASRAIEHSPEHAIYATSWKKTKTSFPMVWSPDNKTVSAINVTARYAKPPEVVHELSIRLYSKQKKRIAIEGVLLTTDGQEVVRFITRDEQADLNDMPKLNLVPGQQYRIRFRNYQTDVFTAQEGIQIRDIYATELKPCPQALPKDKVDTKKLELYNELVDSSRTERLNELESREITIGDKTLKWTEKTFGTKPKGGRSLWISMHGGGAGPKQMNDQQWNNQSALYQPKEGIYLAPRAPSNTWNLWHEGHIDPLFERLIENFVALQDVDPDRVYLLGYSAGGDGVWQLAPRMADRFAAAAMMAGHPNEASLLGLRNLPFALYMGGEDAAYNRNKIASEKAAMLKKLQQEDPVGYIHRVQIYEGLGHWMKNKDREALPWMAEYSRNPWPKKIVWYQDDVTHDRFYWLKLPAGSAKAGDQIIATVKGQQIELEGTIPSGTCIRLSDQLVSLDEKITVSINGKSTFSGNIKRSETILKATLEERLDPAAAACAEVVIP